MCITTSLVEQFRTINSGLNTTPNQPAVKFHLLFSTFEAVSRYAGCTKPNILHPGLRKIWNVRYGFPFLPYIHSSNQVLRPDCPVSFTPRLPHPNPEINPKQSFPLGFSIQSLSLFHRYYILANASSLVTQSPPSLSNLIDKYHHQRGFSRILCTDVVTHHSVGLICHYKPAWCRHSQARTFVGVTKSHTVDVRLGCSMSLTVFVDTNTNRNSGVWKVRYRMRIRLWRGEKWCLVWNRMSLSFYDLPKVLTWGDKLVMRSG